MCEVLVLGAERPTVETCSKTLRLAGHRTREVFTVLDAVRVMAVDGIECLVLHERAPGYYRQFVRDLRDRGSRAGVVVVSLDERAAEEAYSGLDVWSVVAAGAAPDAVKEKVAGAYEFASMSDTKFEKIAQDIDAAADGLRSETAKARRDSQIRRSLEDGRE